MSSLGAVVSTVISRMRLERDADKGATMIEYGLIITFVAMVVIVALFAFGPWVEGLYTRVFPWL